MTDTTKPASPWADQETLDKITKEAASGPSTGPELSECDKLLEGMALAFENAAKVLRAAIVSHQKHAKPGHSAHAEWMVAGIAASLAGMSVERAEMAFQRRCLEVLEPHAK